MILKQVEFDVTARNKLIKGIETISKAVGSTLGARGKTVLIESGADVPGITVTKDGVTVCNNILLEDATENLAVLMMREGANRTAKLVGDATTTTIVLSQAIVNEAMNKMDGSMNSTEVYRGIKSCSEYIIGLLNKKSKAVNGKMLRYVSTVSCNGDAILGKMISDVYKSVGKLGTVIIEDSLNDETYSEVTNGMRIERGWASKYFINDIGRQECILENPYILVTDKEIDSIMNIEHILRPIIEQKRSLLIIGELGERAMAGLNANVAVMKVCQIIPPDFGYKRGELLQDIASATGAKYFSSGTGDNFELLTIADLGEAEKVIVGIDNTVLITKKGIDISDRIAMLKQHIVESRSAKETAFLKQRVSNLNGSIGVIYVGGNSELEQKEKKDRIDDSVCATSCALEEGILAGGGIALLDISRTLGWGKTENERIACHILKDAIQYPFKQILTNGGVNPTDVIPKLTEVDMGYDISNMVVGNMFDMGIIDPAKVTTKALENAVSVAINILSTNCIITNVRNNG